MTREELVQALLALDPVSLRDTLARLAKGFDAKAEGFYDADPEENGLLAQPYSDLSYLMEMASQVFEQNPTEGTIDEGPEAPQHEPQTVTAAIAKKAMPTSNPWGRR